MALLMVMLSQNLRIRVFLVPVYSFPYFKLYFLYLFADMGGYEGKCGKVGKEGPISDNILVFVCHNVINIL